jgi:hypothetical protein
MSTGPTAPSTPAASTAKNSQKGLVGRTYLASPTQGETLASVTAELYLYDVRFHQFVRQSQQINALLIELEQPFTFALVISLQTEEPLISQLVDPRMTPTFNREHHSFVWNWFDEENMEGPYSWSIKFTCSETSEAEFRRVFSKCIYETLNQEDFMTMKKEEQDWVSAAYQEDVEMDDAFNELLSPEEEEENDDDQEEVIVGRSRLRSSHVPDSDNEEEDDEFRHGNKGGQEKNTNLTVGYKNDRSYVFRGDKIGVFSYGDDDSLKFQTMITPVTDLKGQRFTPQKVMLHEQDSAMLMMNPSNDKSIFKMDLETGKVVEGGVFSVLKV